MEQWEKGFIEKVESLPEVRGMYNRYINAIKSILHANPVKLDFRSMIMMVKVRTAYFSSVFAILSQKNLVNPELLEDINSAFDEFTDEIEMDDPLTLDMRIDNIKDVETEISKLLVSDDKINLFELFSCCKDNVTITKMKNDYADIYPEHVAYLFGMYV